MPPYIYEELINNIQTKRKQKPLNKMIYIDTQDSEIK